MIYMGKECKKEWISRCITDLLCHTAEALYVNDTETL